MATATVGDTRALLAQTRNVLSDLDDRQLSNPLSILKLSEPISSNVATGNTSSTNRSSSASEEPNANDLVTPTSLTADLSHYRDLFTKLHFSYIEQVTKEKYLRAIVGDPPILHTHQENVDLENETLEMKRSLKAKKVAVEEMVERMKGESERLAHKWEDVKQKMEKTKALEKEVSEAEQRASTLRREVEDKEAMFMDLDGPQNEPEQRLNLEDTLTLIAQREQDMKDMESKIRDLQQEMPARTRDCEILEKDLEALEKRKNTATMEAVEARRRKEKGEEGGRDEVEERGRWYRSQEQVYRGLGLIEG